jgi:hypothetical protein
LKREWSEVIELAARTSDADDVDLQILICYAIALWNSGQDDPALVVDREAPKSKKRDLELLWWARYNHAKVQLRLGRRPRAKSNVAMIYAENPRYAGVAQQLAALD